MTGARPIHRHNFAAMGSTVELTLVGGNRRDALAVLDDAIALAADWEATFSRFRPDSELSRLNARSGQTVAVSERLYAGISTALDAARATGGLFDPTILPALLALGYDRTFEDIGEQGTGNREQEVPIAGTAHGVSPTAPIPVPRSLFPVPSITLPAGAALDLGGIAKGLYADELAARLANWPGGCVSAGGDLRLWGVPPAGQCWTVGVEDPDQLVRDVAVLELTTGAVATSGTNRRAWRRADRDVHHLIDPRTGQPADRGVRSVTVVAATAARAEVWSTALFVGGLDDAVVERAAAQIDFAVVVMTDGTLRVLSSEAGGTIDGQHDYAA
jgi:thiamine biosynthesis lipoprotein